MPNDDTLIGIIPTKLGVRLFPGETFEWKSEVLIPLFHEWIRRGIPEGIPIDVADYSHLPEGPVTMIVGHEGDLICERQPGRSSLVYLLKRSTSGETRTSDALGTALERAFQCAASLEKEYPVEPRPHFNAARLEIFFNDRLNAPNTAEFYETIEPAVQNAFVSYPGLGILAIGRVENDPRERLTVSVESVNHSQISLDAL
ncbi:MAG: hypothetical protein D6679_03765 [Candidatus Hydrogenedentota bacterium]|nr:MAG: hypothetical protein D6679_03765 [Candidatus Hydrogenedentota bacterium]